MTGGSITINGMADGNAKPLPQGDAFTVAPYNDGSVTPACGSPGNCIAVYDKNVITGVTAEVNYFQISGVHALTINGGAGTDSTEFTGDFIAPGIDLTVNTESIKIDSTFTVTANNVNFNAAEADDGTDALGIDSTFLGDEASISLDSANLNGANVDLEASATNAKTTVVHGGDQTLLGLGDTLVVATTTPFLSKGEFTIAGLDGQTCDYTGTDSTRTEFTGVTGCVGVVSAPAEVDSVGIPRGSEPDRLRPCGTPDHLRGVDHDRRHLEHHGDG